MLRTRCCSNSVPLLRLRTRWRGTRWRSCSGFGASHAQDSVAFKLGAAQAQDSVARDSVLLRLELGGAGLGAA